MDDAQAAKLRSFARRGVVRDIWLGENRAGDTIIALLNERDAAMALLRQWDALIAHQYTGTRAAMDAMHQCAQETRALLGPSWPSPRDSEGRDA